MSKTEEQTIAKKPSFEEQLRILEMNERAPEEIIENAEEESKQTEKAANVSEKDKLFEFIAKNGGPSTAQINEWKEMYGDKVYITQYDDKEFYIYRYLTHTEYKSIKSQVLASKADELVKQDLFDGLIIQKCILFPTMDPDMKLKMPGGTPETLAAQIRYSSNFIPEEIAIRMIAKL